MPDGEMRNEVAPSPFPSPKAPPLGVDDLREQMKKFETAPEPIMQFFAYAHLPHHLQEVSQPFGQLANLLVASLPRNPERTVALRKLLESKDAAVRAQLAK
jgi:hypothetical protein